jgi:hypothetical protein
VTVLRRELTARFGRRPPARSSSSWRCTWFSRSAAWSCSSPAPTSPFDRQAARVHGWIHGRRHVCTHTSSHYATSERRWVNEALTFFGYPFFLGLSATFWWNKHVVVHPAPNVIDVDDDADFMPWLALTDRDLGRTGSWRRFYQHLQWWLFPIVLAGSASTWAVRA